MDVDEGVGVGIQLGERAGRDGDAVADAAHLERAPRPSGTRSSTRAAQRPDHRRRRRSIARRRSGAMSQVAQRERGGVGRVGRLGRRGQTEPGLHHPLHLRLAGPAPPGDRFLHLVRRVLHDLAPRRRGLGQGQAAGLADAHGRAHVDLEEHLLDGHDLRAPARPAAPPARPAARPGAEARATPPVSAGRPGPRGGPSGRAGFQAGVATARQARIDAKHEHRFEPSRCDGASGGWARRRLAVGAGPKAPGPGRYGPGPNDPGAGGRAWATIQTGEHLRAARSGPMAARGWIALMVVAAGGRGRRGGDESRRGRGRLQPERLDEQHLGQDEDGPEGAERLGRVPGLGPASQARGCAGHRRFRRAGPGARDLRAGRPPRHAAAALRRVAHRLGHPLAGAGHRGGPDPHGGAHHEQRQPVVLGLPDRARHAGHGWALCEPRRGQLDVVPARRLPRLPGLQPGQRQPNTLRQLRRDEPPWHPPGGPPLPTTSTTTAP